ncbi:MAG: hypothetical protein IID08_00640 [Candidatus Hydrogenedentes bacterium]|nr:hypothetical protein [Candidatus Hydrogenedentota bacterium]
MFDITTATIGMLLIMLIAMVCLIFLSLFMIVRSIQNRNEPAQHVQTDLTNMTILFNTMRDILTEQKDLARRFNASLDAKVGEVRAVIDQARELATELDKMKKEVDRLVGESHSGNRERFTQDRVPAKKSPQPSAPEPIADEGDLHEPEVMLVGGEQAMSETIGERLSRADDLIDGWTGMDFGTDDSERPSEAIEEHVHTAPEDAAGARDAFRALLNFATDTALEEAPYPESAEGINGNGGMSPLALRVYEYSDAGMRVPEIARELGLGKGEIRLMLNLRKDREH